MSDCAKTAESLFSEGYNCAQSVLAGCAQQAGLPRELALKVALAYGGGVARTGGLCGAVCGALMLVGFTVPMKDGSDAAAKGKASQLGRDIMEEFQRRNQTLVCRELIGCDLMTEEGRRRMVEIDAHHKICPKFVRDAAEIAQQKLFPTT